MGMVRNGPLNPGAWRLPRTVAALAVLLHLLCSHPAAQRFRSGIDLVTVDAVVLDRDGLPVTGLTRADFTVLEDGRPQKILEFQSVELPPPIALEDPAAIEPAPARRLSFNSLTVERVPGRSFVLLFDDVNLTRLQGAEAKRAIRAFVERSLTTQDSASLVTTSGGGWFHAGTPAARARLLELLDRREGQFIEDSTAERMSDFEAMRIHVFQDQVVAARVRRRFEWNRVAGREPVTVPNARDDMPRVGETHGNVGVVDPYIESRAAAVYAAAVARGRMVQDVLQRVIGGLSQVRGPRSVILLSRGFIHDPESGGFGPVTEAARRANVAIHFVDARGLVGSASDFTAAANAPTDSRDIGAVYAHIGLEAEGAVSLAESSGGTLVRNTNDLSAGLTRIADRSRTYYLLGYAPPDGRPGRSFRRIEVKVKRPGLTVRARRGYEAPEAGESGAGDTTSLDPEVRDALDAPRDVAELPLRATALVFDRSGENAARVMVAAEVDARHLQLEPDQGRYTGTVQHAVAATHLETGRVFRFDQTTALNLRPETRQRLDATWYLLAREFTLPAGAYQARVVVRDRTSGRIGSVTHDFHVPPPDGLRVSSPILTDQLLAENGGRGAPRPVLVVRRSFASGTTLYCQFTVYGAERSGAGPPDVTGEWALRRADGSPVRATPPTRIEPGSDGGLMRLYGISLAGVAPGDYELVIGVRDAVAGRRIEVREPFTVVSGVGLLAARLKRLDTAP